MAFQSIPASTAFLFVSIGVTLHVAAVEPTRVISSLADRSSKIRKELAHNKSMVEVLYQWQDSVASDTAAREAIQAEIEQYHQRDNVLTEELREYSPRRNAHDARRWRRLRVLNLRDQADQFRRSGFVLQALALEAKAREIARKPADDTVHHPRREKSLPRKATDYVPQRQEHAFAQPGHET